MPDTSVSHQVWIVLGLLYKLRLWKWAFFFLTASALTRAVTASCYSSLGVVSSCQSHLPPRFVLSTVQPMWEWFPEASHPNCSSQLGPFLMNQLHTSISASQQPLPEGVTSSWDSWWAVSCIASTAPAGGMGLSIACESSILEMEPQTPPLLYQESTLIAFREPAYISWCSKARWKKPYYS